MQEKPNGSVKDFYANVPPGTENYRDLVVAVIASLDPHKAKMLFDNVFFVFTKIETNAFTLPMRTDRQAYIIFVIPPSRPFLEVIAHELAHFLSGHHLHALRMQEGSSPTLPNLEFEADAERQAQEIIRNYTLWRDNVKDKVVWNDDEKMLSPPVYFLRQGE